MFAQVIAGYPLYALDHLLFLRNKVIVLQNRLAFRRLAGIRTQGRRVSRADHLIASGNRVSD
ncbi:hypothetical protein P775_08985 [Puniceibacterium antarcticum]|uniref:Uncharacterized protein n=1 Tax=Puniceibacterium antarcticum TaxID=1206336 RepID=A0A2G8RGW5_9RHOB|nr:hypothetical protein [Puniceibacterium antarcticum]PIL20651.1 hypothetical protein P775_08985 [Puniceibacterium antarcticum]